MKKLLTSMLLALSVTGVAHGAGDAATGQAKTAVCTACHGEDGNSVIANFPKLAGQNENYLLKQMKDIKTGVRPVVEMTGLLDALSEEDLADIAVYFAKKNVQIGHAAKDQVDAGQKIYRSGVAGKGVAACTACHGPQGGGNSSAAFPAVSGQHAAYVEKQLKLFRTGDRSNDPNKMMQDIAAKLSDKEIKAVSSYIQGLN